MVLKLGFHYTTLYMSARPSLFSLALSQVCTYALSLSNPLFRSLSLKIFQLATDVMPRRPEPKHIPDSDIPHCGIAGTGPEGKASDDGCRLSSAPTNTDLPHCWPIGWVVVYSEAFFGEHFIFIFKLTTVL